MITAAVAWDNLADEGSVSVSDFITRAPGANLQNPQVGTKWRINAASTYIVVDLLSSQSVDTIMLAGLSGEDPDFRVRLSSLDTSGAAGDVADSGTISGVPYFDPNYGMFVFLLSALLSARYVRIDISEAAVEYIEAGRIFVGSRDTFENGQQTPWVRGAIKGSVYTPGVSGQTFVDLRPGYWRVQATFGFATEDERNGFVEAMSLITINFGHLDFLFIKDIESDNLARDSVWGYVDGDITSTQDLYIIPPLYAVQLPVRQRL